MSLVGADDLSLALAAAAHPVRRDLMAMVAQAPARVTDLAARFAISLPAVSRHVRVLEAAGFVTRRIAGRDHFIAARPEGMAPVSDWVTEQSAAWQVRLDALKRFVESRDA
jgi:DNA-binding transcriptional ArsR family regulator